MTKGELVETINRYNFRSIKGVQFYYSKATENPDTTINVRVGEWAGVLAINEGVYKVQSMSRYKAIPNESN